MTQAFDLNLPALSPAIIHADDQPIIHSRADLPTTEPETMESTAARIQRLESELSQLRSMNKTQVVLDDKSGDKMTADAAAKRIDRSLQMDYLASLQFDRELREIAALQPTATPSQQKPVLDANSAAQLFGLERWQKLPNAVKAKTLDIRPADVQKISVESIFGRKSDSGAAHRLDRENPGLYRLLKVEARRVGLI